MGSAIRIREDNDRQAFVDIILHYRIKPGDRAIVTDNPPTVL
jgi:hypothetical protein